MNVLSNAITPIKYILSEAIYYSKYQPKDFKI